MQEAAIDQAPLKQVALGPDRALVGGEHRAGAGAGGQNHRHPLGEGAQCRGQRTGDVAMLNPATTSP